jgi:hypothetical protein
MESNTPNTPAELLAMQVAAKSTVDGEGPEDFAIYMAEEILPDLDPSPYQTVKAVEMLLRRLYVYHFEMLHDDEVEMDAWTRNMWDEDCGRLKTALDAVRLINPD